jgi:hypothetical protein
VTSSRLDGYGPVDTTQASRPYVVFDDEASPALQLAQHRARNPLASEVLPQPQAIPAVVFVDTLTRTLTARLPDKASGYERLLWVQGWQALRRAEQAGWPPGEAPWVLADVPGAPRVVHGVPVDGAALSFTFPVGVAGFGNLVGKPGVVAIATVDTGTHWFLNCKFYNR